MFREEPGPAPENGRANRALPVRQAVKSFIGHQPRGKRRGGRLLQNPDKAVAVAGNGLDVDRLLRLVAEGLAQTPHGNVQAGLEFHKSVLGPELRLQILAGDQLAWRLQQSVQHQKRLGLELDPVAEFAQISRARDSPRRVRSEPIGWRFGARGSPKCPECYHRFVNTLCSTKLYFFPL